MRVDRQGFFFFASAIASACGAASDSPTSPASPDPEPEALVEVEPDAQPDAQPEREHFRPHPSPGTPDPADEPPPGPPFEGTAIPNDDFMCRTKKNFARPTAAACQDGVGHPGNCAAVHLQGGCSSFQFVCDKCESYKRFFKPLVAQHAVDCVLAERGAQLDEGCRTYQCGEEALLGSCLDPGVDGLCNTVAAQCNTTMAECRGLLSGMNAAGRAQVASCAKTGCSFGIWSCIEGM